jgi:hypothetical protein
MSCEAEELGLDVAFHCEEHIALLSFLWASKDTVMLPQEHPAGSCFM